MASRSLPPQQQKKAIIFGSVGAIVLRVVLTFFAVYLLTLPYLKLVGGLALLVIAAKLLVPEHEDENETEAAAHLWAAVQIVAIADIVMSLDNVIAIAASAEIPAARVDIAHAAAIKTTLIIFGLATSVPLIVAGSAILMALLERFRILVWAGGALLGWVAGDIMASDPAVVGWTSSAVHHALHDWGGPVGALLVVGAGYVAVRAHRALHLDEIMAGAGLVIWIAVDRIADGVFAGDVAKIWITRGVLIVLMIVVYAAARMRLGKTIERA